MRIRIFMKSAAAGYSAVLLVGLLPWFISWSGFSVAALLGWDLHSATVAQGEFAAVVFPFLQVLASAQVLSFVSIPAALAGSLIVTAWLVWSFVVKKEPIQPAETTRGK